MKQEDLAGVEHWNHVYQDRDAAPPGEWKPTTIDAHALEAALRRALDLARPTSILEVGCGDSAWLGYLARTTGARVAGMDYSETGCQRARQRLKAEHVCGEVFCSDLFRFSPQEIGQYDFVYSLGLVEHFADLVGVLAALTRFVAPGGVLFTEVPNLRSVHGLLAWVWQPELLAKHHPVSRRQLRRAYEQMAYEQIDARFCGVFSLDVVAWEYYPRWPRLASKLTPKIRRAQSRLERHLPGLSRYRGNRLFSPYVCVHGRKPAYQA